MPVALARLSRSLQMVFRYQSCPTFFARLNRCNLVGRGGSGRSLLRHYRVYSRDAIEMQNASFDFKLVPLPMYWLRRCRVVGGRGRAPSPASTHHTLCPDSSAHGSSPKFGCTNSRSFIEVRGVCSTGTNPSEIEYTKLLSRWPSPDRTESWPNQAALVGCIRLPCFITGNWLTGN
ncbi:hypothetical protein BDW68DRAFT_85130 [Aspergillus falconensis]